MGIALLNKPLGAPARLISQPVELDFEEIQALFACQVLAHYSVNSWIIDLCRRFLSSPAFTSPAS